MIKALVGRRKDLRQVPYFYIQLMGIWQIEKRVITLQCGIIML